MQEFFGFPLQNQVHSGASRPFAAMIPSKISTALTVYILARSMCAAKA